MSTLMCQKCRLKCQICRRLKCQICRPADVKEVECQMSKHKIVKHKFDEKCEKYNFFFIIFTSLL